MENVVRRYNFLQKVNTVEEYVSPDYYNNLLKPYVFGGRTDLEIFENYLDKVGNPRNILEFCSGSGRVSEIALRTFPNANFVLSDLSQRMLDYTKNKFKNMQNVQYLQSDAVNLMGELNGQYDLIYTLWGFSHSVHQHIHNEGVEKTKIKVKKLFEKMLDKNMLNGSKFYLVHFDSMSDEQKILMRQWQRVYPTFSDISKQSPSKIMLDEIFHELDDKNKIILTEKHLVGDPILYKNEEILLEIFLNFHLETYFNQSNLLPVVINDIKKCARQYKSQDGTFAIKTGCYIYEIEKR